MNSNAVAESGFDDEAQRAMGPIIEFQFDYRIWMSLTRGRDAIGNQSVF